MNPTAIDDLYPLEFFTIIDGRIVLLADPPIINCERGEPGPSLSFSDRQDGA